jgi:hypothetical protein
VLLVLLVLVVLAVSSVLSVSSVSIVNSVSANHNSPFMLRTIGSLTCIIRVMRVTTSFVNVHGKDSLGLVLELGLV